MQHSCLAVALRSWGSIRGAELDVGNEEDSALWRPCAHKGQWEQPHRLKFLTAQPVLVKSRPIFLKCSLAAVAGVQHAGDLLYNAQAPDEIFPLQQGLHPLQFLLLHDFLWLHAVQVNREQLAHSSLALEAAVSWKREPLFLKKGAYFSVSGPG